MPSDGGNRARQFVGETLPVHVRMTGNDSHGCKLSMPAGIDDGTNHVEVRELE